jgi:hypothetical protein
VPVVASYLHTPSLVSLSMVTRIPYLQPISYGICSCRSQQGEPMPAAHSLLQLLHWHLLLVSVTVAGPVRLSHITRTKQPQDEEFMDEEILETAEHPDQPNTPKHSNCHQPLKSPVGASSGCLQGPQCEALLDS